MKKGVSLPSIVYIFLFFVLGYLVLAQTVPLHGQSESELIERGRYLATVAACADCHTPARAEFNQPTLTTEQILLLSYNQQSSKDEALPFAGGRIFDLGPAGIIVSTNITSDPQTGIGAWTDAQLEQALRTGQTPNGRQLHPIMPYNAYNQLSTADMTALIAYLRSLRPIAHDVLPLRTANTQDIPAPPMPTDPILPPTDQLAYGEYLLKHLLACADCHTPTDSNTGQIATDQFLSGGQPFEGVWGIVYGGNITPDVATGIGSWDANDIKRALLAGVRPDGRRLVLMPWEHYAQLNGRDLDALVAYLQQGVTAVSRQTPNPALHDGLISFAPITTAPTSAPNSLPWAWIGLFGLVLLCLIFIIWYTRRNVTPAS